MSDRLLTYIKGDHQYSFRCTPGRERELIDHITRLAEDLDCNIDWVDAAMLSFSITCAAARQVAAEPEEPERV